MPKNGRIFPYKYGVHYNTGQRKSTVPSDQHKIKTSDRELGYKTENVKKKWLTTVWTGNNFFVCNIRILIRIWTSSEMKLKKLNSLRKEN